MNKERFTVHIFDTLTGTIQDIEVTEEVYRVYRRTIWEIKNRDRSFRKHEILFSSLIGGADNGYEAFHEFVSDSDNPKLIVLDQLTLEQLATALGKLTPDEFDLIRAIFVSRKSEQTYADELGVYQNAVHKRKKRILKKLKTILTK